MPGLTVVHLEPTPNDRDPVGHMAAPTDHAPIQNTREFASLPISASCGAFDVVATCGATLALSSQFTWLSGDAGPPLSRVAADLWRARDPRGA